MIARGRRRSYGGHGGGARAASKELKIDFGTFGPNNPDGGRPMPARIGGVEIGWIERVVTEEFRSASSYAKKVVVLGYQASVHPIGLRAIGADDATIARIYDRIDGVEYRTLALAKNALRAAVALIQMP